MSGWDDDEWGSTPAAPVKKESVPVKTESAVSSGWDDDGWGSSSATTTTATSTSKSSSVDDGWGSTSTGDGWGSSSGASNSRSSGNNSSWGGNRPSISAQSMNKGWSVSGAKRESSDNRNQDTSSMNGTKNHSSRLNIPGQIFVDKLSIDATVTDLRSTFGRFGKITRITIDYKFDDDKAFAWLSFENELSVEVRKSATCFKCSNRY